VYRTYRLFIDYEKEEYWLNQMAAKGYNLINYFLGLYTFDIEQPGKYIYRIELLDSLPFASSSIRYITFLKEMGIEHISSHFRWVYFRKLATEGPFDIYSDIDSRILHYSRIVKLYGIVGLSNLVISISNFSLWLSEASTLNLKLAPLNLLASFILIFGANSCIKKIRRLKKERQLRE